eukprot:scaffold1529_cov67-Skeletonema_dohrnii-CCMP3373.AAC.1
MVLPYRNLFMVGPNKPSGLMANGLLRIGGWSSRYGGEFPPSGQLSARGAIIRDVWGSPLSPYPKPIFLHAAYNSHTFCGNGGIRMSDVIDLRHITCENRSKSIDPVP